jgi:AraC family transcriptional regulator of adaptative response/methylated-DNA-[protein]-cysteine methyltransferase
MPKTITIQRETATTTTVTTTVKETINMSSDALHSDALWEAVRSKDRRFDGMFWFAVKTTGIYCRPSCSSREPKRENVLFVESPEAAQKQGFRACKRCNPDQIPFLDPSVELVQNVCGFIGKQITENPDESLSLEFLSEKFTVSADSLQRTFTATLGISPREFADAVRLARFKEVVKTTDTISEAMHEAGYGSSSRLHEKATAIMGMTPASYKKNGKGAEMFLDVSESALGYVLIAGTKHGICAVDFVYDPSSAGREYKADMEEAVFSHEHPPQFWHWQRAIFDYIKNMTEANNQAILQLPLDVITTAFQAKVWSALRAIPFGETRTYTEIAEAIGQPKAHRAVATACASNPVALVTPCHRVIRAGGDISGYRWGVERKQRILEREKRAAK